jgi:hypothetical protein
MTGLLGVLMPSLSLAQSKSERRRSKTTKLAPLDSGTSGRFSESAEPIAGESESESTLIPPEAKPQSTRAAGIIKRNGNENLVNDANLKGPTWMYRLGLVGTPGIWYETNSFESVITASQGAGDSKAKDSDGDLKIKGKIQLGGLSMIAAAKAPSKKIAYGFTVGVSRVTSEFEGQLGGTKIDGKQKTDIPKLSAFVSSQVRPGIWAGYAGSWGTTFKKETREVYIDTKSSDTTATKRLESSTNAVSIEIVSATSHAGLEVAIESDKDEMSKSVTLPLRFSVTDTMFTGFKLTGVEATEFDSGVQSVASSVEVELGQQFVNSAYRVFYEYLMLKESSATSGSIRKQKTLSAAFIFGPPKGVRLGVTVGYNEQRMINSDAAESAFKLPYLALVVGSWN